MVPIISEQFDVTPTAGNHYLCKNNKEIIITFIFYIFYMYIKNNYTK